MSIGDHQRKLERYGEHENGNMALRRDGTQQARSADNRTTYTKDAIAYFTQMSPEFRPYLARPTPCTGVCERNTPPEKKMRGKMGFQSTKSGGREQFLLLLLDCGAAALVQGVSFRRHLHHNFS